MLDVLFRTIIILALFSKIIYAANYAVTPAGWDDMGSLLTSLGYPHTTLTDASLSTYSNISPFDVLFLNCSPQPASNANGAKSNLKAFVDNGGSLYASDWAYIYVQTSFSPEAIKYLATPQSGQVGIYECDVLDKGLRDYLGVDSLSLNLNLPAWVPIDSVGTNTIEYLRGKKITGYPAHVAGKPMLASFRSGQGTVIYTTFHNEAQLTALETKLLEYLVLLALTASLKDELAAHMQNAGYTVANENINKINNGETSVSYTYDYTVPGVSGYELAFAAHWRGAGSVRIEVLRPDDSVFSTAVGLTSPVMISVPSTESTNGAWKYRISGLSSLGTNEPYAIMSGRRTPAASNINEIIIAPNPFKASRGDTVMVFDKIPAVATLRIFTVTGELVRIIEKNDSSSGSIFWDLKADDGDSVASGLYLYQIVDSLGNKRKGKIAVIR